MKDDLIFMVPADGSEVFDLNAPNTGLEAGTFYEQKCIISFEPTEKDLENRRKIFFKADGTPRDRFILDTTTGKMIPWPWQ